MNRTLIILCLAVASAFGLWDIGFKVKYSVLPGSTSFMSMPQTVTEANEAGYVNMTGPDARSGYESLFLMCPEYDLIRCLLFDDNGYVAGLQISFASDRLTDYVFDMTKSGYSVWNVTKDGTTTSYFSTQQYFVTSEELDEPAATRLANRDNSVLIQNNLVLPGYDGDLHVISTNTSKLTSSNFTEQGCFVGMGRHYYYKMSSTLECTHENILSWFLLEYDDQLVGSALLLPAKFTLSSNETDCFESPSTTAIKLIVTDGPDCYYEYADTPGMITMHIYYIKHGYLMSCIW